MGRKAEKVARSPLWLRKPTPMLTRKKRLPLNEARKSIAWLGELLRILHDPTLSEQGDLYHGQSWEITRAYERRYAGRRKGQEWLQRREESGANDFEKRESWRKLGPIHPADHDYFPGADHGQPYQQKAILYQSVHK